MSCKAQNLRSNHKYTISGDCGVKLANILLLCEKQNEFQRLQANKVALSPQERQVTFDHKAVWHHGPGGTASSAIKKSVDKNGKVTFYTHTHRAFNKANTLKGAIKRFHDFIKGTA